MVKTLQVQYPVDGHMRPMGSERFVLFARLARDDRRADHQFAQEKQSVRCKSCPCEGEHICGLVLAAIVLIQAAAARIADDANR